MGLSCSKPSAQAAVFSEEKDGSGSEKAFSIADVSEQDNQRQSTASTAVSSVFQDKTAAPLPSVSITPPSTRGSLSITLETANQYLPQPEPTDPIVVVHQEAHVLPEVEEREEVQPNSPQDSAIATSPQNGSHPKIGAALDRGPTNEYDSTANKVDSEDQELVPNDKDRVYPSRPSSPTPLSGQHGRAEDAAVNDPEPTQEPGHTLPKENQTHSAAPSESQTTTAPAIEPLIIRDPKDPSYSLSTFSPKAIRVGQRVFGSVEAALQATKFADVDKRDALWASSGAWMAFSQAQSWAFYVRPDWFSHGHDEVLRALQTLKASQHPEVKACLLQSRNAPVIDSSSTDQVFCLRDGKGDNKAGQSWQDVRHVLQAAQDDNQKWEHSVEQADLELRKWLPECFR